MTLSVDKRTPSPVVPADSAQETHPPHRPVASRRPALHEQPPSPLAKPHLRSVIPSAVYVIERAPAKTQPKPSGTGRPLGTRQAIEAAIADQTRGLVAAPAKPRPPVRPAAAEAKPAFAVTGGAPLPIFLEARDRMGKLEARHEKACAVLELGIRYWSDVASQVRKAGPSDLSEAVAAERQVAKLRSALSELKLQFAAATREYDVILGRASGAAIRSGGQVDPRLPSPKSAAERFRDQLVRYDRAVEAIKKAGLATPIAVSYIAGVDASGRKLSDEDYRVLEGISGAGQILGLVVGANGDLHGPRGAATPEGGVDRRGAAQQITEANAWQARQPVQRDR